MWLKKRTNNRDGASLADALTREYLAFCKTYVSEDAINTGDKIVEMFRYGMCEALKLPSQGYLAIPPKAQVELVKRLSNVLNAYGALHFPEDARQGILEACVHSIEMSRERAGV